MTTQEIKDQEIKNEQEGVEQSVESGADSSAHDTMSEEPTDEDTLAAESTENLEQGVDWKDRYIRLQAEFDNYRKRTLKEKMELVGIGGADVVKAFLPVIDDMQRAVASMEKSDDIETLRDGVRLISQKMQETLKQRGVNEIEAIGEPLDTDYHEAVARFAAGEDKKDKIIDVVQSGYTMGEKVLRFAKVVVGE